MTNRKFQVCGFNSGKGIEEAYNMAALKKGVHKVAQIQKPIVIPTVDVNRSEKYIFTNCKKLDKRYISEISVGTAVRASSSFPGVFCPCDFQGHKFLDGGILDNIPVQELKKQGTEKVICVNFKADNIDENSNFMDIAMRTIDIMGNKISEESIHESDFVLTVDSDGTGLLDIEKLEKCYRAGYRCAMENMDQIQSIL